jgi:hypothetical protein
MLTSSRNIPLLLPPRFTPENVATTKPIEVQPKIEPYYLEPEPNAYPTAEVMAQISMARLQHPPSKQ